jgi:hypothetical protein
MLDVIAINPLVAFYDIHGRKREVLFFYFVPDTTRDLYSLTHIIRVLILIDKKNEMQSRSISWNPVVYPC